MNQKRVRRSETHVHSYKASHQMPLVEICARKRILLENHHGILRYDVDKIVVKVCFGSVVIQGSKLKIAMISREKLVIAGVIDSVCFVGENG